MRSSIESWYKAIEVCGNVLYSTEYTLNSIQNLMSKSSSADKAGDYYVLQQQFMDAAVAQMNYLQSLASIPSTIWRGSQSSVDASIANDANYQLHELSELGKNSPPIPPVVLSYNIDDSGKFLYAYDAKNSKKQKGSKKIELDPNQLKTLEQLLQTWRTANGFNLSDDSVLTDSSGKPIDKSKFDAAFNDKKSGFQAITKIAGDKIGNSLSIDTQFIARPSQEDQRSITSVA